MINWDMVTEDKKRIFRLEKTIADFKKYDSKRTEYVHELEKQNAELLSELKEFREEDIGKKYESLRKRYKNQVEECNKVKSKLQLAKDNPLIEKVLVSGHTEVIGKLAQTVKSAQSEIQALRHINKVLRDTNAELINKLFAPQDALVILDIIEKKLINKL